MFLYAIMRCSKKNWRELGVDPENCVRTCWDTCQLYRYYFIENFLTIMQNFQQKWRFSDYPKSAHGWAQKLRHCDILSTQLGILHSVAFKLKFFLSKSPRLLSAARGITLVIWDVINWEKWLTMFLFYNYCVNLFSTAGCLCSQYYAWTLE